MKTPSKLGYGSDIRCSADLTEGVMKWHSHFSFVCILLGNTTTKTRRFEMPHCNDTYSGKYIFIILKYINQSEMFLQLARNHFAA